MALRDRNAVNENDVRLLLMAGSPQRETEFSSLELNQSCVKPGSGKSRDDPLNCFYK